MNNEIQKFVTECVDEEDRVEKVLKLNTLEGIRKAIEIWESHFKQQYVHGVNTKRDIARVNVIRRSENREGLC